MHQIAERVSQFGTTIFAEMTGLANQYQAINLGQGFPDFPAPDFIKRAAQIAIDMDINQYPPANGRFRLRVAIAQTIQTYYGMEVNPDNEVTTTHGATEALYATILGLVNPGDEVVVFEPTYDSYVPAILMAGGIPRYYPLRPPNWEIDPDDLAKLFSDKTRMVLVNTPHNPIGKVFSRSELEIIAKLCQKYNVIAVCDEVYEHIVFDDHKHVPLATLEGMKDRTLTISSAGKTFSTTGWKVGWVVGHPSLIKGAFRVRQWTTFAGAAPFEEATAIALELAQENGYYEELKAMYQAKRDLLAGGLKNAGIPPLTPAGTYFIMADISGLGFESDVDFCRHLVKNVGVAAIPPSAFYNNPEDGKAVARFAFCKRDEVLQEAVTRLSQLL
jgi:N-succinyldiaminopimelate aminotransferase